MQMKKPLAIYFVAAWSFLGLVMAISGTTRALKPLLGQYKDIATTTSGYLCLVSFVHYYYLVQLRQFNRWLAVGFFMWWTTMLAWNYTILIHRPNVKVLPFTIIMALLIGLNLVGIWYLTRRKFRQFAIAYAAERDKTKHSDAMNKASKKRMLEEIGK